MNFFIFIVQTSHNDYQTPDQFQLTDEQRVLYYLLRNYERTVRPVKNASDVIVVKLGLTLTNIFDVVREIFKHVICFFHQMCHNSCFNAEG